MTPAELTARGVRRYRVGVFFVRNPVALQMPTQKSRRPHHRRER